ncbi:MAG: FtsX-like permease family protein [Pseudomonadota bacterium]
MLGNFSNLLWLTYRSLRARRGTVLLATLTIAVSVALVLAVERVRADARASFTNTISGADLIVGGRTSPLNLLLYSIFRLGDATSGMSWDSYEYLRSQPQVAWTIPLSLGDAHKGFRVLGTDEGYFEHYRYASDRALSFAAGRAFTGASEAVLGADVARDLSYDLGTELIVSHGIGAVSFQQHDDQPLVVAGILARTGTPVDRTVHVALETIDAMHGGGAHDHADEDDAHGDEHDAHSDEHEPHGDDTDDEHGHESGTEQADEHEHADKGHAGDHEHADEGHDEDHDHATDGREHAVKGHAGDHEHADAGQDEDHDHTVDGHDEDHEHADKGHDEDHEHADEGHDEDHDHATDEHHADHEHAAAEHHEEHDHADEGHEEDHDHASDSHDEGHEHGAGGSEGHDHDHGEAHGAITAAIVGVRKKGTLFTLQRNINEYAGEPLLAAIPGVTLSQLWQLLGVAEAALFGVSACVVLAGLIGLLTTLLTSLNERRRELAVLRSVGARPAWVFALLTMEGAMIGLGAALLGTALTYGAFALGREWVLERFGFALAEGLPGRFDVLLIVAVTLAAALIAAIPAWRLYRHSLADGLKIRT